MGNEANRVVAMYVTKKEKQLINRRAEKSKMSSSNYLRSKENLPVNFRGAPSPKKLESRKITDRVFEVSADGEIDNPDNENIMISEREKKLRSENDFLHSMIEKMVEEFSGNIVKSISHLESSQMALDSIQNQSRMMLNETAKTDSDKANEKQRTRRTKIQMLEMKIVEKSRGYETESKDENLPDDPNNPLDF